MPHNGKTLNVSPATSKNLKIVACGAKLCRHTTKRIVAVLVPILLLVLVVLVVLVLLLTLILLKGRYSWALHMLTSRRRRKFSSLVVLLNIYYIAGFGHFWTNLEFVLGK
jgi:hypothetical protein